MQTWKSLGQDLLMPRLLLRSPHMTNKLLQMVWVHRIFFKNICFYINTTKPWLANRWTEEVL